MAKLYNIELFLYREKRERNMYRRDYIDSAEVAEMIGLCRRMVSYLAEQYELTAGQEGIPSYRFGKRKRLFDRVEIDRWIRAKHASVAQMALSSDARKVG